MNTLSRPFLCVLAGVTLLGVPFRGIAQQPAAPAGAPAAPATADVPPTPSPDTPKPDTPPAAVEERAAVEVQTEKDANGTRTRIRRHGSSTDFPFGDHTVPRDSRMREVISVFGSSTVEGETDSDAVSVLGDTTVGRGAKVGGAAVSVLGSLNVQGSVRDEAVSVLGRAEINGPVNGDVVCVLGNMQLGPRAVIDGDIVVVGGRLTKDPEAIVRGNQVNVSVLGNFGDLEWFTTWIKRCLFFGRPLAFGGHLGWAWAVAFSFLGFYLLLALLFSQGIVRCAETLEKRPGYSVLSSVVSVLLTPIAIVLLAVTVVGALLVPFLCVGLFFAGLFGKAVMLAWIGRRFTKFFGDGPLGHPVVAVLLGGVIVMMIYLVPIMGFLTYGLLSWLGFGVVIYTIALSMKRDKPAIATAGPRGGPGSPGNPISSSGPVTPVSPTEYVPPYAPTAPVTPVAPVEFSAPPSVSPGFAGSAPAPIEVPSAPEAGPAPVPPTMSENAFAAPTPAGTPPPPSSSIPPVRPTATARASAQPAVPGVVVWPRAGFFIRLGALALDGILIGLLMAMIANLLPRFLRFHDGPGGWLIALAIYGAVMWRNKGTTIGGIVCGLKVVRVDNREIDWATAIVRALGCFLSLAVAGLGFIWVAIDDEKQSWHDKIAGTAVVVVPKGVSLL